MSFAIKSKAKRADSGSADKRGEERARRGKADLLIGALGKLTFVGRRLAGWLAGWPAQSLISRRFGSRFIRLN